MVRGGVTDVLIANLIVGEAKLKRLANLCKEGDPIVCIDHLDQANPMSEVMSREGVECRAIIEVNIGLDRVGCSPQATLQLARQLHALPGIKFAGIMGYEGHLLTIEDQDEKRIKIEQALKLLADNAEQLKVAGIPCDIVPVEVRGRISLVVCNPNHGTTGWRWNVHGTSSMNSNR